MVPAVSLPVRGGITRRGWKVIGAGIGIAAIGFYILSLTDPSGQNWASKLSPFLILIGYAVIALGIISPQQNSSPSSQLSQKI